MNKIEHELRSQPAVWRRAMATARASERLFPAAGERVALLGCGTSFYVAQAIASYREDAGTGLTDAFSASELPLGRAAGGTYDRYVAVSRSGTTTEVLEVIGELRDRGAEVLAVTGDAGSPVGEASGSVVEMPFADEESVVQTRFATACVALWRAHLGHDIGSLASACEDILEAALPEGLLERRQFVFLGRGPGVGLASEAALKVREAAGAWSESYPAMEVRHGPISGFGSHTLVWPLGDLSADLRDDVLATGAHVAGNGQDPLVELVGVHRAAVELARHRGLDPDRPLHLTRSVVLASAGEPA